MTIRDLMSGDAITDVLSRGERGRAFSMAIKRLSDADQLAIRSALDARIAGRRIETSSWIPGADWTGTPYQPIYDDAARQNFDLAARIFGLFVWEAFERHSDDWYTERFSMGTDEDRFRVYFKLGSPH